MKSTDEKAGKNFKTDQPRGLWHPRRNGKAADADLKSGIRQPSLDPVVTPDPPSSDPYNNERTSFFD